MRRFVFCLAILASKPVGAGHTIIEADGSANLGVTQRTQSKIAPDPNPEAGDVTPSTVTTSFLELRPGIGIARGNERLYWRARYQFAGILSLTDFGSTTYTNQAEIALLAVLTKATAFSLEAAFAQGGTQFLLGQRAADTGNPEFRAPGNPNLVRLTVAESLNSELTRELQLQQSLAAVASAPQSDLSARSASLIGTLALQRVFRRDQIGLELRAGVSQLKPLQLEKPAYFVQNDALLLRWNRDLSRKLSGLAAAGVEQVYMDVGARPVAVLPTGIVSLLYSSGTRTGAIEVSHASNMNLQLGTATATSRIAVRGQIVLDPFKFRTITFSAGALHNAPLAEAAPLLAIGTGNALQSDIGFATELSKTVLATARYSILYQFDQPVGIPASLVHIGMIGITALYSNSTLRARQRPSFGRRVDGSDAITGSDRPPSDDRDPSPK